MSYKLDSNGNVVEPFVHDSTIFGIVMENKDVEISTRTESGDRLSIRLLKCVFFRADNVLLGNIVSELTILSPTMVTRDHLLDLLGTRRSKYESKADEYLVGIRCGELLYIELSSSYGLEAKVLCKDFDILELASHMSRLPEEQ